MTLCARAGHKIKNPSTQSYKALQRVPARTRVLITGTPMQNNFMELHALFDFCCPGLLGSRPDFKRTVADRIQDSQVRATSPNIIAWPFSNHPWALPHVQL